MDIITVAFNVCNCALKLDGFYKSLTKFIDVILKRTGIKSGE